MAKMNEKKELFGAKRKRSLPLSWHFSPNVSLFLEKTKFLNTDKTQMTINTKYTLLQSEYNELLRSVKTSELLIIK